MRLVVDRRAAAAALVVLYCAALGAADNNKCPKRFPNVKGIDQSPTDPKLYGKCTSALDPSINQSASHWCKFNKLGYWPGPPSETAKQCLKFGRMTIYRGPIYGSSPAHKAACNKWLQGGSDAAMVAVSTKYLKTWQGGWAGDKGSCGKCMCVRMHGADPKYNPGMQREGASKHLGLTFLAKVGDRCSECEDDHIDVLLDRPLSYAPFDPKRKENQWAPYVNAQDAPRGFADPSYMRTNSAYTPEAVGVWVADWQWVPCSFSHAKCGELMRGVGYKDVDLPKMTPGVDSFTLRPLSTLRVQPAFVTKTPWS